MGICFGIPRNCCGGFCFYDNELLMADASIKKLDFKNMDLDCKVVHVYDGDTVHIVFRFGGNLYRDTVRLGGIDAPELKPNQGNHQEKEREKQAAIRSRDYLAMLSLNKICLFKCKGKDKYGRLLGDLYVKGPRDFFDYSNFINIKEAMLISGNAIQYDGGTKTQFKNWN